MPRTKKSRRKKRRGGGGGGGGGAPPDDGRIAPNIDINETLAAARAYDEQKLARARSENRPTRNIHAHVTKKDIPLPKKTLNIKDSIAKLDEEVSEQVQAINDRLESSTGVIGITTVHHPIPAFFDTMGLEPEGANKGEMSEACLYVYSRLLRLYREADYDVALRIEGGQPELIFRFSIGFGKAEKEEMKGLIEKCKINSKAQYGQFVEGAKNWKAARPRKGDPRRGDPRRGDPRTPPPPGRAYSGPPPTSSGLRFYQSQRTG